MDRVKTLEDVIRIIKLMDLTITGDAKYFKDVLDLLDEVAPPEDDKLN